MSLEAEGKALRLPLRESRTRAYQLVFFGSLVLFTLAMVPWEGNAAGNLFLALLWAPGILAALVPWAGSSVFGLLLVHRANHHGRVLVRDEWARSCRVFLLPILLPLAVIVTVRCAILFGAVPSDLGSSIESMIALILFIGSPIGTLLASGFHAWRWRVWLNRFPSEALGGISVEHVWTVILFHFIAMIAWSCAAGLLIVGPSVLFARMFPPGGLAH